MDTDRDYMLKYAHVISSKNKTEIVKCLMNNPQTPTEISKNTNINISLVSRLLKNLEEEDVIICLNPQDRKGKLYYLSDIGNWIFNQL